MRSGYYRDHYAKQVAAKAAGVPTRSIGGFEVESACILQAESPWAAWLAALLDGEGNFASKPAKISVSMCDRDVLEKALLCTGIGSLTGPYMTENPRHTPTWRWRVSRAADCWVIAHLVLPYLGQRRSEEVARMCEPFKTATAGKVIHGTRAYYKRGCRCPECVRANRSYVRLRHQARQAE